LRPNATVAEREWWWGFRQWRGHGSRERGERGERSERSERDERSERSERDERGERWQLRESVSLQE
jgi:hypothetical protein